MITYRHALSAFVSIIIAVVAILVGIYGLSTGREPITNEPAGPWYFSFLLILLGFLTVSLIIWLMDRT